MSSRAAILSRLKDQQQSSVELPEYRFTSGGPGSAQQFAEALNSVGGICVEVHDRERLRGAVEGMDVYATAKKVLSRVNGIAGNVEGVSDPHQLANLDLAILPGVFGVAENGAVWVDMACLGTQRAAFVIPQHLILVIGADQIVGNMHDAYERLNLNEQDFGVFISGPSKTADIEQALVIGAHGARSCTVFVVG